MHPAVSPLGVILAEKVGLLGRIRKALGGSPSDHAHGGSGERTVAEQAPQPLDILRDTAKDLCSDVWLANQMSLTTETVGGAKKLIATPVGMVPYLKAAYSIRKDELPAEIAELVEKMAA